MDQLPEKAPAQEAMAAPGCQELAVLLTEPGSPLQRDFATVGQDRSAQLGGAAKLRTSWLSGLKRDPAVLNTLVSAASTVPNTRFSVSAPGQQFHHLQSNQSKAAGSHV